MESSVDLLKVKDYCDQKYYTWKQKMLVLALLDHITVLKLTVLKKIESRTKVVRT